MTAVQFIDSSHKRLENKVQAWSDQHPGFLVTDLALSSSETNHCVTLLGQENGQQHRYRFAIVRAYGLPGTDELNQALSGGTGSCLLAQGGNKFGHWTALLVAV